MPSSWRGVFAIPQTPFRDDLSVDLDDLGREVEYMIQAGSHGLVYPVMASEAHTLDREERVAAVERVLSASGGRIPIAVGVTAQTADAAILLARHAADAGADAVVCMPPAEHAGDDDAVVRYFGRLSDAAGLPIVLQNASPPLGTPISVALIARVIRETAGVRYVKEEVVPSTHRVTEILAAAGPALRGVFGGRAGLHMMDELNRGSAGVFPGASWVDFHVAIVDAYFAGRPAEARQLFDRLLPAINMGMMLGLGFTKTVLVRRGVLTRALCRDGSPALDDADHQELDEIWATLRPPRWDG